MLDTPNFFESRWTEAEVARANATNIQLLQVLWPNRNPAPAAALSTFFSLSNSDFGAAQIGDDAELIDTAIGKIAVAVEEIRCRALAARHRYLVNAFCDQAHDLGLSTEVQPTRHILLHGKRDTALVIPLVGVPSALRLNEIHDEVASEKHPVIWVLYDSRGLLEEAIGHLEWLNVSLPTPRQPKRAVKWTTLEKAIRVRNKSGPDRLRDR